jgi:hypothetical protein
MTHPTRKPDPGRVGRLVRAQFWRLRRDGAVYLYASVVPFVVVVGLLITLSEIKGGSILNNPQGSVDIGRRYGATEDSLEVGLLLLMLPSLIATMTAVGAAAITRNLVGAETVRGGLEELLSAPYTPADVAGASLTFVFAIVTALWAAQSALAALALTVVCLVHHVSVHPNAGYLAMSLLVPLLASWCGAGLSLLINLLFPRLAVPGRLGLGRSGSSVGDLLSVLPALGALVLIGTSLDSLGSIRILSIVGGSTALVTVLSVGGVARWFHPDAVLEL